MFNFTSKFLNIMRPIYSAFIVLCFFATNQLFAQQKSKEYAMEFDLSKAKYLYHFAFDCIEREYPNKPGHVLGSDSYLSPPRILHPAFYGCFDWHSSVHGHWTLVTIFNNFPDFEKNAAIIQKLSATLSKENILEEVKYFEDVHNKDFERTYGWAWLLKLAEALRDGDTPMASQLAQNILPLELLIAQKFSTFLDKLNYPIRIGEHNNTAFAMSLAYDYASKYDPVLALKLKTKAIEYFLNDKACPLTWEPGGFDFLSPCLQEASLMLKILPEKEFRLWLKMFLPGFEKNPEKFLQIAIPLDRTDGKLAHLDGLNFSRAWCLFEIGNALNNQKMIALGVSHFTYSYEKMDTGEYAGSHWLASFATYALMKRW